MGLDWIITKTKNYIGPTEHRANGLVWIFETFDLRQTGKLCYGTQKSKKEFATLNKNQMTKILNDLYVIINITEYPECITNVIDEEGLRGHLDNARLMLEGALANKIEIYADY